MLLTEGGRDRKGLSVLCPPFTAPMDCLWALRYGLFKQLSHCGGDTDKLIALHWVHTAVTLPREPGVVFSFGSGNSELMGCCFHLSLVQGGLGDYQSWY